MSRFPVRLGLILAIAAAQSSCASLMPTLRQPERLYSRDEEIAAIKSSLPISPSEYASITTVVDRNNFITLRMYAIDLAYTRYEAQLTHEAQEMGLAGTLVSLGLTGAGSVIPAGETTKALNAAATGITGASSAFDKDILLSQSIQNLETQMRTDRNNEATIILANMKCSVEQYPVGTALTQLETYYRDGTLTNALIGLSKTVSSAEATSKAAKDSVNPSREVSTPAQTQLRNSASVTAAQATAAASAHAAPKATSQCPS
jgi:hypothetical protein